VDVGQAQAGVGVICPVVCQLDHPSRISNVGYDLDLWTGRLRKRLMGSDIFTEGRCEHVDVDSVLGCSNLIKTEVVQRIGRFRDIYGLYFEDTDFNVRVRVWGCRVVVVRQACVLHRGSSTMNRYIVRCAWLLLRNLLLFEWFNAKPIRLLFFLPCLPWCIYRGSCSEAAFTRPR
jgi:GT2 family glycosyltransferase